MKLGKIIRIHGRILDNAESLSVLQGCGREDEETLDEYWRVRNEVFFLQKRLGMVPRRVLKLAISRVM